MNPIATNHIKIHVGPHASHPDSYVEVDGVRLHLVQDVKVDITAGKVSEVTLTMLTQNLDVEGDVHEISSLMSHKAKEEAAGTLRGMLNRIVKRTMVKWSQSEWKKVSLFQWLRKRAETKRLKEEQMERDYQAGKIQFANRPYTYPKIAPPTLRK